MITGDIVQKIPTWPVIQELAFLKQQTGQEEATLFGNALLLGINWLYRQTVEQAFIEGVMPREEALKILGGERLADIEYAQRALAEARVGWNEHQRNPTGCGSGVLEFANAHSNLRRLSTEPPNFTSPHWPSRYTP